MKSTWRRFPFLFIFIVIVPTLLAVVYYYRYASQQYVSEAQFVIQGNSAPKMDFLGALTGIPSAGSTASDSMIIKSYLGSNDFLKDIESDTHIKQLKQHYSKPEIDFYSRLQPNASQEKVVEYWQNMAEVDHDLSTGVSTIRIASFDPETSRSLVVAALQHSEKLINQLSNRVRTDTLQHAEKEAKEAGEQLNALRSELTRFREKQDVLDPSTQTGGRIEREEAARLNMLSELQAELAKAEAELEQVSAFMQPEALKVKNLQSRVNALKQQIAKEQKTTQRQTTGKNTQAASQLAKYTELQSRQAFAEQLYQSKLAALEQARLEQARQQRYLTVIVQPNLPEESTRPDRLSGVLTVLLLSFLTWGIGSLSIAAIRDHIGWV